MRILLLVDQLDDWSGHNRAKAIKKFMLEHNIEIRAGLNNPSSIDDQEQFDLVHFTFSYGLTDYYDFILKNKNRVVITVINERSLLNGHGVDVAKFEYLLRTCPWVTSVGRKIAEMVGCTYIRNGIDLDKFDTFRKPVVGYSGTDRKNKNVELIIEACAILDLNFRSALYHRDSPEQYLPHEKMKEFYNGLDVFVHASATEGFNNTIIEALACNVPVIMTKEGCWHEFEGYADFIEPNVGSITNALKKYAGRRLILDRFLWNDIVPIYKDIYERASKCAKT